MVVRRTSFVLAILLFTGGLVHAQGFWYEAYEQAMKAMDAGNWAQAETLLLSAKSQKPEPQGKKVRSYGTRFMSYLPDYQLGIVYAKQGKMQQAIAQFDIVKSIGVPAPSDPEYQTLQGMLGPNPIEEAKALVKNAEEAFQAGRITEAKRILEEARKKDSKNPNIALLASKIERAEQVAELLNTAKRSIDQGQLFAAQKAVNSVIQLDPSNPQISALKTTIGNKEANIKATASNATTLQEIEAVRKSIQNAQSNDRENPLYASILDTLSLKEKTLQAKQDKELKEKQERELAVLLDKSRNALTTKNYELARDFAKQAQATGVDEKRMAADLLKQIATAEYENYKFEMQKAYQAKNFPRARELGQKAIQTGADATEVKNLLNRIEVEENVALFETAKQKKNVQMAQQAYNSISLKDPSHPKLKEMQSWIAQSASSMSVEDREKMALISYYQGSYETANRLLTQIESEHKKSPRVYFYLGCTNAAMAFKKEKNTRDELLKKATQLFAQVRALDPAFTFDDRYISPRIIKVYQNTPASK